MTIVKTQNLSNAHLPRLAPSLLNSAFRARRRQQAGQSVLIVLGVLFLIAFLGALFVLVVIRNLQNAQRQNQVLTADYYAQAGIKFADSMLQTSPLGADWRPPLQYAVAIPADVPGYNATLPATPSNDPDYRWLSDGYTRYNLANGRFLLRITYNPAAASLGVSNATYAPTAKYLRIEVVGRQGVVDSSDPTTYTNSPPESLRAERTAYKPIGLVDYARFITNKDNTSDTAALGVPSSYDATNGLTTPGVMDISSIAVGTPATLTLKPYPITTNFGNPSAYSANAVAAAGGGSVRCNGNLRLYGNNQIYLDGQFGDDWEIEGNLTFDQYSPGTAAAAAMQATQTTLIGTAYNGTAYPAPMTVPNPTPNVFPSNDTTNFITLNGLIRDGNSGDDTSGNPRSIGRLNPPIIDATDPVTNLTRYQVLTKPTDANGLTSSWNDVTSPNNLATVYINNGSDIQTETTSVSNPTTLREEWLRTAGASAPNWFGNFYNPPGVTVTFGQIINPLLTSSTTVYWGFTLTRTDTDSSGTAAKWPGTNSSTVQIIYGQPPSANFISSFSAAQQAQYNDAPFDFLTQYDTANTTTTVNSIVIYADGNVRVHGVVSNPNTATSNGTLTAQHVTVVTNGIAYVDGSILRGVEPSAPTATTPQIGASVALLAKQYVCLNTTQFMMGATDANGAQQPDLFRDPIIANNWFLDFTKGVTLTSSILLPTIYADTVTPATSSERLYISQEAGPSQDNPNVISSGLGDYSLNGGAFTQINPAATPSTPNKTTIPLTTLTPTASATPFPNMFSLTFQTDAQSVADWMEERAAVLPADIKIEAVLYAQDNSFFVIPGEWFNTDTADTFSQSATAGGTTMASAARPSNVSDTRFPYHGQPIDMQITIMGSISENMTADIADQAAWMQKWGWIPEYHGSTSEASPHAPGFATTPTGIGTGLNFVYDPLNGFPVVNPSAATPAYLRQDVYGRVLPSVPALPVSPDLLYNGQPTSQTTP